MSPKPTMDLDLASTDDVPGIFEVRNPSEWDEANLSTPSQAPRLERRCPVPVRPRSLNLKALRILDECMALPSLEKTAPLLVPTLDSPEANDSSKLLPIEMLDEEKDVIPEPLPVIYGVQM